MRKALPAPWLLRPPGAGEEGDFLARCLRCGKCGAVCPYGVIVFDEPPATAPFGGSTPGGSASGNGTSPSGGTPPGGTSPGNGAPTASPGSTPPNNGTPPSGGTPPGSTLFGGNALSGTPRVYPARGACRLCADFPCVAACPSGALQVPAQRSEVRMGLAQLDRDRCVALKGMRCEVCYRSCPLIDEAIHISYYLREGDSIHAVFEPVVDSARCVGCGICEQRCVIQNPPAIRVSPRAALPETDAIEGNPLDRNPNLGG
jgi:ferredoxin